MLKGLNSPLAQSAAKLCLDKIYPEEANHIICVTFSFLSKIRFLSHGLAPDVLESQLGSIDAYFGTVSKKI